MLSRGDVASLRDCVLIDKKICATFTLHQTVWSSNGPCPLHSQCRTKNRNRHIAIKSDSKREGACRCVGSSDIPFGATDSVDATAWNHQTMTGSYELPRWNTGQPFDRPGIKETRANKSQVALRTTHSPLSRQSRKWLLSLARIKFQIELAAQEVCEGVVSTRWSDNEANRAMDWGREDEYRSWSQDITERAARKHPVTEDEAWPFLIDTSGLWIWHGACVSFTSYSLDSPNATKELKRNLSSRFVKLALQLLNTASAVKVNELSKLNEIIDAIELQLRALGSFGDIYYWELTRDGFMNREDFCWHRNLRSRIRDTVIRDAIKQADSQKAIDHPKLISSHVQHYRDHLLLQTTVCVVLLACLYPLYRTLKSSSPTPGSTSEADFWQQMLNSIVQLAGFLTLLLPIYRETAAKEWIGTWILTILGSASAIIAVPIYLCVPVSWSALFSWLASSTQLLVVLQLALVAAFQNQEHAKQD